MYMYTVIQYKFHFKPQIKKNTLNMFLVQWFIYWDSFRLKIYQMLDCIQTFYLLHSVPEATSTNVIWNMHFKSTKSAPTPPKKNKKTNLICLATRENGTHICQNCKWRKSTVGSINQQIQLSTRVSGQ